MTVPRSGHFPGRSGGALAFAAAILFAVAFTFCAIAAAYGFYPDITQPATGVSAIGLVVSVVWLHLKASSDDREEPSCK